MTHDVPALLSAALTAAENGWPVFPLRPGDKRPAGHAEARCPGTGRCARGHRTPEQRATTDPDMVRRCWERRPYGVGIATGPAGLVVIDLDTPKGPEDIPPAEWAGYADGMDVFATVCERAGQPVPDDTYTVRTGRGGLHLYFSAPSGKRLRSGAEVLGWKVDVRAWGGYVVAAGNTVHRRPYVCERPAPPAPLPEWLGDLLTPPPAPAPLGAVALREGIRHVDRYATAALRGEVEKVQSARQGGRNAVLFKAACSLGRLIAAGTLPEELATGALADAGMSTGLPYRDCERTIRSGFRRSAAEVSAA
ncbi:MAG TPA: DNA primase [Streptomyces sp.]|nr:DNA primase [Streptomyces sp.]